MLDEIDKTLKFIRNELQYPDQFVLQSATGPEVIINNKKVLLLGSYNYLGLANNEYVKKGSIKTLKKYGVGSGGVRMLTGTLDIHNKLEKKIAAITRQEDAMTIPSGYGTNIGVIPGIVNLLGFTTYIDAKKAAIFSDEHNHASIIDGTRLSHAKTVTYRHCDVEDLEEKLKEHNSYRKLIITDGVFSMDGDVAPLDKIIDLAKEYNAFTMVDDAHAFGVLGEDGAGTADYLKRPGQVDINMGAFSKGIGVSGGFISAKKDVVDLLRVSCRSYLFSDSLSPAVVGAVDAALDFVKTHPNILNEVQEKNSYFRQKINQLGFSTFNSSVHVVPMLIGDPRTTIAFVQEMLRQGLFAPAIRWPAVPQNLGRIRFSASALHSYEQIDRALNIINTVKKTIM